MSGMSSQVMWNQPWGAKAEATLKDGLISIGCTLRELSSQQWDPKTATIGGIRDCQTSYIAPASNSWSSVMLQLNSECAEPLASALSKTSGYSIVFLEYDQATWGYCIFEKGMQKDRFWNIPAIIEEDEDECKGNAEIVSAIFGVPAASVLPYIRHVGNDTESDSKAFQDDEHFLSDHWVRCDFMHRLGLIYPNPGETKDGRHVQILESPIRNSSVNEKKSSFNPPASSIGKPWWKFW